MPGDLRGIGSDGYETALQSFGMMDVEMEDAAGNKLQLAPGQQALLTFTIPDSLQSIAPATIPLWYFNDTTGRWIEQGSAMRQGNTYVGQVGHFTYWNCDAPMGTVNFTVHIADQYGNPIPYHYIQFTLPGYVITGRVHGFYRVCPGADPAKRAFADAGALRNAAALLAVLMSGRR